MSKISKLGLGIIAFEGPELIKSITYELRDVTDFIVVCLQKTSYHGDPIKDCDVKEVEYLKEMNLIDEIIWFEPENFHTDVDPKTAPRLIEADKRNFILDYLEYIQHCSHSMIIDSDEFYDHDDFINAKNFINENDGIHVTYCQYINYYRDYRHLLVWPYLCYVPFITEASYRFNFNDRSFVYPSDPTRRYHVEMTNGNNFYILPFKLVKMHHLSWIRRDIAHKIDSWSSKKIFENVKGLRDAILERYNNYHEGQNAIITFNVPFFQVAVNSLNKQYIHPKYGLDDIPEKYNLNK